MDMYMYIHNECYINISVIIVSVMLLKPTMSMKPSWKSSLALFGWQQINGEISKSFSNFEECSLHCEPVHIF